MPHEGDLGWGEGVGLVDEVAEGALEGQGFDGEGAGWGDGAGVFAELRLKSGSRSLSIVRHLHAASRARARSDNLNRVSRQPNILLLKPVLEADLEPYEELAVLGRVFHVNKHPGQAVPVELALMVPETLDGLGLARDNAKSLLQLLQGISDQIRQTGRPSLNRDGSRIS